VTLLSGVLDANASIGLAKGNVFHLLAQLYAPLYVPQSVVAEVTGGAPTEPGAAELTQALGRWILPVTPSPQALPPPSPGLSLADREVIAVAIEKQPIDHILTDDGILRREAGRHGLHCLRVPQLVVLMKSEGLVPAVQPVLDQMRQAGHGIRESFYQQALRAAGE
jgi:predicted nucleic acid-binding protein